MADTAEIFPSEAQTNVPSAPQSGAAPSPTYSNEKSLTASPGNLTAIAGQQRDMVDGRYRIHLQNPISELSSSLCSAFEATDEQQQYNDLYCVITTNTYPYRNKTIEALKKISHPALSRCYAAEAITLSNPAETRMVFIFSKPRGKKLSEIISEQGPLNDRQAIDRILRPLNEVLQLLHEHKINHGSINPDNLYFDGELSIRECIGEPSGFSQDFHYEPPERLITMPSAKGSGNLSADCYALGVLAIFLCNGSLPYLHLSQKQFTHRILHMGSYNAYMQTLDFTDNILDLLRGTLIDSPHDRWNTATIETCLNGKRYNLIPPSIPRDSSRPFTFQEEEYFNQKALAHALHRQWSKARTELSPVKLVKWMELSTTKSYAAERMAKLLHVKSDSADKKSSLTEGELARVIALLDPTGPMRFQEISVNIDGLGTATANSFGERNTSAQRNLLFLIESGLPGFLSELNENQHNSEAANMLWQLQNLRPLLLSKGLGFSSERLLYHMNPSLACQSESLLPYHCDSIASCMNTLNMIYAQSGGKTQQSLIDAHLAAFLACKLDIKKELKVIELSAYPDMATDNRLVMLKLLTMCQQKMGNTKLPDLCQWVSTSVMPVIGRIHQRSSRELLIKEVKKAAKSGLLENIAFTLFKSDVIGSDKRDYEQAKALHDYHHAWIEKLQDKKRIINESRTIARNACVTIAYFVLALTLYWVFDPYVSF